MIRHLVAIVTFTTAVSWAALTTSARAQTPTEDVVKGALGGAVEAIIINEIKDKQFVKEDNWGHRRKTPFGRKKDGLWKRFSVKPEDPQNRVDFKITKIERKSTDTAYIEARLSVYLRGKAEAEYWVLDVKAGAVDARARATMITTVGFDVKLQGDLAKAEFSLEPAVTKSEVEIKDFVLDNLGAIGGTTAKVLGDAFTKLGEDRIKEAKNEMAEEVKESLQKSAEKADLRVKLRDFLK